MDIATLTDVCRHLSQDIADTGRTFKNVSTIEAHLFGNVPKRIHNVCRSVISTICTHYSLFIRLFAKQFTEFLCNGVRSIRCIFVESLTQTAPAAKLAKGLHLFFCSLFATFKQQVCKLDSLDVGFDTCIYRCRSMVFATFRMVVAGVLGGKCILVLIFACNFENSIKFLACYLEWSAYIVIAMEYVGKFIIDNTGNLMLSSEFVVQAQCNTFEFIGKFSVVFNLFLAFALNALFV